MDTVRVRKVGFGSWCDGVRVRVRVYGLQGFGCSVGGMVRVLGLGCPGQGDGSVGLLG